MMDQCRLQRGRWLLALVGAVTLGLSGCHSAFIQATVVNATGRPIQLFEVDYPQASFGSGPLNPGTAFHYRFKVSGTGPVQVTWTDASEHEHKEKGPELHEGEEGTLMLTLQTVAQWNVNVHQAH